MNSEVHLQVVVSLVMSSEDLSLYQLVFRKKKSLKSVVGRECLKRCHQWAHGVVGFTNEPNQNQLRVTPIGVLSFFFF